MQTRLLRLTAVMVIGILSTEIDDGMINTPNRVQVNGDTIHRRQVIIYFQQSGKERKQYHAGSRYRSEGDTDASDLCGWHQGQICESIEAETGCTDEPALPSLQLGLKENGYYGIWKLDSSRYSQNSWRSHSQSGQCQRSRH